MPPAMASSHLEMTLYVIAPKFKDDPSSHSITLTPGHGWALESSASWRVTLTLVDRDHINVAIKSNRSPYQQIIKFRSMRIIPRSNFLEVAATDKFDWSYEGSRSCEFLTAQAVVPVDCILEDNHYNFTVVFSTELDLVRSYFAPMPLSRITPAHMSKENSLTCLLLKDPSSVDICFTFTSDKTYSNIGLWAHRCVLSQYDSFSQLIQEAKTLQSLGDMVLAEKVTDGDADAVSDAESIGKFSINSMDTATGPEAATASVNTASRAPLVIKVGTFSLATFCVMLYYIYTGDIDRTVHPDRFVLSDTKTVSLVWRNSAGKVEESVTWHPLDQNSPWRLKDVTWKELKEAAVHYGLKDLEAAAHQGLQSDE